MPLMIGNKGMQKDYIEDARQTIAIVFDNGNPPLRRSDYPMEQVGLDGRPKPWIWHRMVMRVAKNPQEGGRLIKENTPEGRAFLAGVTFGEITQEYLMGLNEDDLATIAKRFGVKPSAKAKVTILGILKAKEEGVQMAAASGE
jgi:hypothetical protein